MHLQEQTKRELGWFHSAVAILILAVALHTATSQDGSTTCDDVLLRKVTLSVSGVRIGSFVRQLAETSGVRIHVEEARWFADKADDEDAAEYLAAIRSRGISMSVQNAALKDVLDQLIALDDRYIYSHDHTTGAINIYPRENAPMRWTTPQLKLRDVTVREFLVTNDVIGLSDNRVLLWLRGNLEWLDTRISVKNEPASAREVLNIICNQLEFPARWETYEIVMPDGTISHMLLIRGVSKN